MEMLECCLNVVFSPIHSVFQVIIHLETRTSVSRAALPARNATPLLASPVTPPTCFTRASASLTVLWAPLQMCGNIPALVNICVNWKQIGRQEEMDLVGTGSHILVR